MADTATLIPSILFTLNLLQTAFAHYVRKADIVRSNVEGVPVIALCGKRWIPNRDPAGYPVCPTCKELKGRIFGS